MTGKAQAVFFTNHNDKTDILKKIKFGSVKLFGELLPTYWEN